MTFSVVQWFALIIAVFALIKIIVVLAKPKAWIKFAKKIWKNSVVTGWVCIILAAIVLYFLLMELTIIQVFAAMLFTTLLIAAGIAPFSKELMNFASKIATRRNLSKGWWLFLIWLALIAWVLWTLFL